MKLSIITISSLISLVALAGLSFAELTSDKLVNESMKYSCTSIGVLEDMQCWFGTPMNKVLNVQDSAWSYEIDKVKRPITVGMILAVIGLIYWFEDSRNKKNNKPMKRTKYTY